MNTMNNKPENQIPPFVLKNCELIAIATHKRTNTLKEFRDHLDYLSPDSLYYHFWAHLLLPHFDKIDDFRHWLAFFGESYQPLIDRLTGIDPYFNTLVNLRQLVAATFQNYFKEVAP